MTSFRRANLTIKTADKTIAHAVNLGRYDLRDTPHRGQFLFRFSAQCVNDALRREPDFGKKAFLVVTEPVKYDDKGKAYTVKGIVAKPLHGKEAGEMSESISEAVTVTFELQTDE